MQQGITLSQDASTNFASLSIIVHAVLSCVGEQIKGVGRIDKRKMAATGQLAFDREHVLAEVLTEFLSGIASGPNQILQKHYKAQVTELFTSENFFSLNERTLKKW